MQTFAITHSLKLKYNIFLNVCDQNKFCCLQVFPKKTKFLPQTLFSNSIRSNSLSLKYQRLQRYKDWKI